MLADAQKHNVPQVVYKADTAVSQFKNYLANNPFKFLFSFIPGTKGYSYRKEAASKLQEADSLFQKMTSPGFIIKALQQQLTVKNDLIKSQQEHIDILESNLQNKADEISRLKTVEKTQASKRQAGEPPVRGGTYISQMFKTHSSRGAKNRFATHPPTSKSITPALSLSLL